MHTRAMNRQLRTLIAIVLLALAAYIAKVPLSGIRPSISQQPHTSEWYPVVRVSDGDTIVVRRGGKEQPVRLIGINTPEVSSPYTKQECFGKEASAEAKRILNGTSVRLEADPTQDQYDKYRRLLAYVYMPANSTSTGIMFNEYMVREGFAREYTYKVPYEYQAEFKADAAAAQAARKGLWGTCPTS